MRSFALTFHFVVTFFAVVAAAGAVWVAAARREFSPSPRAARLFFGVGWAVLAVGELAHGAGLARGDADERLLALRVAGLWLIALSLIRGAGTRAHAVAMPLVAGGSGALAGGALAALLARRSGIQNSQRIAAALLAYGLSEGMVAVVGNEIRMGDEWGLVYHLLRLAGAVALASWLWRAFAVSIQVRFVAAFLALLLVVIVAISSSMSQIFVTNVRNDAEERILLEAGQSLRTLRERVRESVVRAKSVADQESVRMAAANRSPELAGLASRLQAPGGLFETDDFMAFLDPSGAILGFSSQGIEGPHLDEAEAVSLAGTAVVQSALSGAQAGSLDSIGAEAVGVLGAFPIRSPAGFDPPGAAPSLAGAVVLGQVVDGGDLESLKGAGQELTLLSRDRVLTSTFADPADLAGALGPGAERLLFGQGESFATQSEVAGSDYFSAFVPVVREDGRVIAVLAASQLSGIVARTQEGLERTLFPLTIGAAGIAIALASLTGSRITRPLRRLTEAADKVRAGDLGTRVDITISDEVGALGRAFNQMTESVNSLTHELKEKAEEEYGVRSQLEAVLQSMTDAVVAMDTSGKVITMNRSAERLLNVDPSVAIGRPAADVLVLHSSDGSRLRVADDGLGDEALLGFVKPDTPVALTSAVIRNEDGIPAGAVAVLRDMTGEREIDRMKSEFISNISHELRTPLTPIKGYASLLRQREVPRETALSFLDDIITSAAKLERTVELLVDFSAMEAGRLSPETSTFDLGAAVQKLVEEERREAGSRKLVVEGFKGLSLIEADEKMVTKAVRELIGNAVKFSPEEGTIWIRARVDGEGALHLSVQDKGVGITEEVLSRLTGAFVQGDASATRAYGGLGLGLAYARRVVEAHGGTVLIESKPDKGARFTLVLPPAVVKSPPRRPSKKPAPRKGSPGRR